MTRYRERSRAKKAICSDRGGLTLEAAIILPMIFFLLISAVYVLRAREAEMLWKEAGRNAAEEMELLLTLAGTQDLSNIQGKLLNKIPDFLQTKVRDSVMKIISEQAIRLLQINYFKRFINGREYLGRILDGQNLKIDSHFDRHYISVHSTYNLNFLFFKTRAESSDIISLWNIKDISQIAKSDNKGELDKDNIWSENNFSRGRQFRDKYKANLPSNFPDISYWDGSKVMKISSIDLTAPYYKSDFALGNKLTLEINRIKNYRGTAGKSPHGIQISSETIRSRELIIVVPENSPEDRLSYLEQIVNSSQTGNFHVRIEKDQKSYRYEKLADNEEAG